MWDSDATWFEPGWPGPEDSVYVQSTVVVGYLDNYQIRHSYGGWVFVEPSGILIPHEYGGGLGTFVLFVGYELVNNGTLANTEEYLVISCQGDLQNNGTWQPFKTRITGMDDHMVSSTPGHPLGGNWECETTGKLMAGSDLRITCGYAYSEDWFVGDFNLNGAVLDMGSHSLNTTGTLLWGGTVEGDFEIRGTFDVNKYTTDTLIFVGNITITDTLQANTYGGGLGIQKLLVEGNLTNNGWIRDRGDTDNDDQLSLLITGNLHNNGRWTCMHVNFVGSQEQQVSQGAGCCFRSHFYDLDPQSDIIAQSDISVGQNIYLDGAVLNMQGYVLELAGWLTDGTLKNAALKNGFLNSVTAVDGLQILGEVSADDNNVFDCNIEVIDTLQCNTYGGGSRFFDLTVNGNITNQGMIRNVNTGDRLRLHLNADLFNNGTWQNAETVLSGDQDQQIGQSDTVVFGGDFLSEKNSGFIHAGTDLVFSGDFNLGGDTLYSDQKQITTGGWLHNGCVDGARLKNGILNSLVLTSGVEILGTVTIDHDVLIDGDLLVTDTLQSNVYGGGSGTFELAINGSVENRGVIRNVNSGDRLFMHISGDVVNAGDWVNYRTYLQGSVDQRIRLLENQPVAGQVLFDAQIAAGPYQWYRNGEILSSPDFAGTTTGILTWNVPVSEAWYGIFNCMTGEGLSRNITVEAAFYMPDSIRAVQNCTDVLITWVQTGGQPENWNVYRDADLMATVDTTAYHDALLVPGQEYGYSITAVYATGESGAAGPVMITPEMPENLMPVDFSAVVEDQQVLCSWYAPVGCLNADGYNVFRNGVQVNEALLADTVFVHEAIPGTWEYWVEAVYYFGSSEPSNVEILEVTSIGELRKPPPDFYPNPVNNQLNLKNCVDIISIRIFDAHGKCLIFRQRFADDVLDVSILPPGFYTLLAETKTGIIRRKLLKR